MSMETKHQQGAGAGKERALLCSVCTGGITGLECALPLSYGLFHWNWEAAAAAAAVPILGSFQEIWKEDCLLSGCPLQLENESRIY